MNILNFLFIHLNSKILLISTLFKQVIVHKKSPRLLITYSHNTNRFNSQPKSQNVEFNYKISLKKYKNFLEIKNINNYFSKLFFCSVNYYATKYFYKSISCFYVLYRRYLWNVLY